MLGFFKKLFGITDAQQTPVPYKVETPAPTEHVRVEAPEPAKCGCGRSATGLCVGLHKLTPDEWATHVDNPNKAPAKSAARAPAKKQQFEKKPAATKAPAKPKATSTPRPPRKPAVK
jgi:hypothetical protein